MNSFLEKFKWTDKPELKREYFLIAGIIVAIAIGYVKFRSLFSKSSRVIAHSGRDEPSKAPPGFVEKLLLPKKTERGSVPGTSSEANSNRVRPGLERSQAGKAIIERPLFDGMEVTLKGVLMSEVSSLSPENPAEVQITGIVHDDFTGGLDASEVEGARVRGIVSSNMRKKRINISFAEITTKEGRSFAVVGYVIDTESKTLGIAANYSSGLPSRLLGVALDRTIVAADQIGMAKAMEGMSDDSVASKELQRASIETNQQAAMSISAEATKDLRDTPPELSISAGTPVVMKIRAQKAGPQ